MYQIEKLKNGLTILKVPMRGAKSVIVDVFVKVGSRSETPRTNGISHFLEHLFFKGSKKFPTAQELSHALDAIGSEYNANTGKEHTQYYIKAAKKHFRFIFETLTDVIQNPVFAEAEIKREKGVIVEEINMYEDTPMRHVDDVLEEYMWSDQPIGRNIAGSHKSVLGISRNDISSYKNKFYQAGNMILAVAGAFREKELDELIKKHWSGYQAKAVPKWARAIDKQTKPIIKVQAKKTEQYHLSLGFRSYDYNHKNNIPQLVLATILGGGMSSRLFDVIREQRGLAYYVKAGATNYQDTGNFYIKAGLRLSALQDTLQLLSEELVRIKTEPVPERELGKAKEYLKGTLTLALEQPEDLLGWYLEQAAFRRRVMTAEQVMQSIQKVKVGDVTRVANEIFTNNKATLAIVGPKPSQNPRFSLS